MHLHLLHDADQVDELRGSPPRGPSAPTGPADAGGEDEAAARPGRRRAVLAGASLILAAIALDATIISVALPTIRSDLGGNPQTIQWLASVSFLAASIVLVPAGRMVDLVGARRVLTTGALVYVAGSVAAAVAPEPWLLILGRAVQGGGSGIVAPATLVLVTGVYGSRRRGTAIGLMSTLLAVASAAGPLVGGILTDTVGWRVIFVNHAVLALVGLGLTLRAPARARGGERVPLDGRGIVLWAGLIVAFQLAILHWTSLGGLAGPAFGTAAVLLGWALVRVERDRDDPLLDLGLLRIPAVAAATVARVVVPFAFYGTIYYLTLFLQSDAGYDAFQTGLILLPSSLVGVAASPVVGKAIDRIGAVTVLWLGTATVALSLFVLAVVHESSSVVAHVAPGLALNGLGYAMVSVSGKAAPLEAVAGDLKGRVTSLVSVVSKAASGFGVTVATGFFNLYAAAGVNNGVSDYGLDASDSMRSFVHDNLGVSDLRGHVTASAATGAGFHDAREAVDVISDSFAFSMSLTIGTLAVAVVAGAVVVHLLARRGRPR